ncbi:MAG: PQQ-binding-like beta-propeller repeat protein, partial [Pirellulales bacterium]|nr:PQQ-binding-like beta-propeller repeat protein [Pirellulales bacterium]
GKAAADGAASSWLAVGAALEGLGGVDWQRHIVRRRGRWTLVVDMALPVRAGEALTERHWHFGAPVQSEPDGMTCLAGQQALHLQTAGVAADGMRDGNDRAEIVRQAVAAGRPVAMASLLHVNRTPRHRDVALRQTTRAWRVDDEDGSFFILPNPQRPEGIAIIGRQSTEVIGAVTDGLPGHDQLAADNESPSPAPLMPTTEEAKLPWRELRVGSAMITAVAQGPNATTAAGDAQGNVCVFQQGEKPSMTAHMPSAVISLHFLGDDLLTGEDRGAVTRLAPDGSRRWERVIPFVTLPWAYWGEGRSRIREIDAADLSGSGQPQILLANADRRVYALDAEGNELWKAPVEWGVYTAMTVGHYLGQPALMGGTSRPAIHGWCVILGDGGKLLGHYSRPDLSNWSNPCQFRDLRLADLDADGHSEAIAAIDTDCRQLVAYKPDGKLLWDADVAGAAEAVAVRPAVPGQAAQVYCVSNSGYVCALDGPTGKRRFAAFVGQPTTFVAPLSDGRALAAAPTGEIFLLAPDGQLAGRASLGSEITALLRPGGHRAANRVILGTKDGRILVLP